MLCMSLNKFLLDIYFCCSITERTIWRIYSLDLIKLFWKILDVSACVNITHALIHAHALMRTPHIDAHTAHWWAHRTLMSTPHNDEHTAQWRTHHTLIHTSHTEAHTIHWFTHHTLMRTTHIDAHISAFKPAFITAPHQLFTAPHQLFTAPYQLFTAAYQLLRRINY